MDEAKPQDLLIGVKAEQSLRDAVRALVEADDADSGGLELAPVGRKDWVAGVRLGALSALPAIAASADDVLRRLLALDSTQRIRRESVRVWVVPPPVPVFKDPADDAARQPAGESPSSEPAAAAAELCPVCGRSVHSYNLQFDTRGRPVGCFMCGGDPSGSRS